MNGEVLRVLLVEDNPVSAQLAKAMLAHAETSVFEIQTAGSLMDALDLLGKGGFDVILLDLSGAARQARALGRLRRFEVHAPHDFPFSPMLTGS